VLLAAYWSAAPRFDSRRKPKILAQEKPPLSMATNIIIKSGGSHEVLQFERMLRVKPYPKECPYSGIELFQAAQKLRLQPEPNALVSAALRRFYSKLLGRSPGLFGTGRRPVLEHVCDGATRLPTGVRRQAVRLHASDASLLAGREAAVGGRGVQHVPLSALQRISAEQGLQYVLPYAEGSFDAVLSHDVVPYSEAPLALFAELHRVVRPGGTLCVTFSAPPPKQPASDGSPSASPSPSPSPSGGKESAVGSSEWAKYATCDPRSASLAWLQAADGADLLYMVGSFFFYSAEWAELEVS